jgi:hypothetical protein
MEIDKVGVWLNGTKLSILVKAARERGAGGLTGVGFLRTRKERQGGQGRKVGKGG